jgi:hypothetical protein
MIIDSGRRFYRDSGGAIRFASSPFRDRPAREDIEALQRILAADHAEDTRDIAWSLICSVEPEDA